MMAQNPQLLLDLVKTLSGLIVFFSTSTTGLAILAAGTAGILAFRIAITVRQASQLAVAAGTRLGMVGAIGAILDTLGSLGAKLLLSLPTLIISAALALTLAAAGQTIARLEESAAAARRIQELSTLLRNLERSVKVADIRVLSVQDGQTRLALDFYAPSRAGEVVEHSELVIRGRDIYFDAIVLNFDYALIAEGRRVNIAIPYRIFSDEVPQSAGIPLGAMDPNGVPFVFQRADDDIYGLAPQIYRDRLTELLELVRTDDSAREAGIVRSLYGSAVHTRVSPGDRLELRVEQTGGLTVRERFAF